MKTRIKRDKSFHSPMLHYLRLVGWKWLFGLKGPSSRCVPIVVKLRWAIELLVFHVFQTIKSKFMIWFMGPLTIYERQQKDEIPHQPPASFGLKKKKVDHFLFEIYFFSFDFLPLFNVQKPTKGLPLPCFTCTHMCQYDLVSSKIWSFSDNCEFTVPFLPQGS